MAVEAEFYSESFYPNSCFGLQDWNPLSGFVNDQQSQFPSSSLSFGDPLLSMAYAGPLMDDLELLRQEVDCILQFQDEQLRLLLYHHRRLQMEAIFDSFLTKSWSLMTQKEDELARAVRRTMELNENLKKAEAEKENIQKTVTEQDEILKWLSFSIEQAKETMAMEDEESAVLGGRDSAEKSCIKMECRRCSTQISCVLLLPCGHLCSCPNCEPFLDSCPVCGSAKASSVEALFV